MSASTFESEPWQQLLRRTLGDIDIYVFDQLLKGRIAKEHRVLDAGAGGGRNLTFLLTHGGHVWAVDRDPEAVRSLRAWARALRGDLPADWVREEPIERMSFADESFDVVMCSAVLHFSRDSAQFHAMVEELWRVLAPGGLLFARLASRIGQASSALFPAEGEAAGRYRLGDGSTRYLVDETVLADLERALGATRVDDLKTTVVDARRSMTTWVVRKSAAG